jgi:hypothetical protein
VRLVFAVFINIARFLLNNLELLDCAILENQLLQCPKDQDMEKLHSVTARANKKAYMSGLRQYYVF